jgi:peptidoglycan glycosyltransferase
MAEAALQEKVTTTTKTYRCEGLLKIGSDYVLHEANNQAHGKIDLEQALVVSCNITFGQLALDLGRNNMAKAYTRYGFNKIAMPDLNEQPVVLPDFNRLGDGDLAQTGIGQGSLLVTPIKMAMLAATFANGGTTMQPYIVQKVLAKDGTTMEEFSPASWLSPVSGALAAQVSKMMVAVVEEGTGSAAAISGVSVAGKTGTAENPHGAPHAWFIGFAPASNPEVAIAVVVENGGSGGGVAAPVARQVISQALR